jgi:hypothetical protein
VIAAPPTIIIAPVKVKAPMVGVVITKGARYPYPALTYVLTLGSIGNPLFPQ